jgi:hypothetical protein
VVDSAANSQKGSAMTFGGKNYRVVCASAQMSIFDFLAADVLAP